MLNPENRLETASKTDFVQVREVLLRIKRYVDTSVVAKCLFRRLF